jgi:hypothetical protein
MGSIYRFERIDRFLQLVDEKALTFVLPELWPDKNEGYLFRAVQSKEGIRKVEQALRKIAPAPRGLEIGLLKVFRQSRYAQCWSKCYENDALWKGYDVRIEADRDDVSKLDSVQAHDVRYVDSINLEDELRSLFAYPTEKTTTWRPENVLLIKQKKLFQHEEEVRLLTKVVVENVVNRKPPWVVAALIEVFRHEYQQGKMTKEEFERRANEIRIEMTISRTRKVSIADVPNFIRSVMLRPSAPDDIDREMARFCSQHSLNYLGKSRMYEFQI